jgi:hypothetical protein
MKQQHWLQQEDFTLGLDISRLHYVKTGYGVVTSANTKLVKNQIKVEIFLEQREVAFLSPSKICENLNFSREIQILLGDKNATYP